MKPDPARLPQGLGCRLARSSLGGLELGREEGSQVRRVCPPVCA